MDHYRTPEMPEPADPNWRHPVESMEPIPEGDCYRAAAKRLCLTLNRALIFIIEASDNRLAAWQVAYAMGLPVCEGVSMTDRSVDLGVCRAAFSKGAKAFLRSSHLPPSEHMKSADATGSYAEARANQLANQ